MGEDDQHLERLDPRHCKCIYSQQSAFLDVVLGRTSKGVTDAGVAYFLIATKVGDMITGYG